MHRSFVPRLAGAVLASALVACPPWLGEQCDDRGKYAPFEIADPPTSVEVRCVHVLTAGSPEPRDGIPANPDYHHILEFEFEGGLFLSINFQNQISAPVTLGLGSERTTGGYGYSAYLFYRSPTGAMENPCPAPEPGSGWRSQSGLLQLDELQVDSDGFLTNFHGSIEATSYNCTFSVDAITVKDRPLTIRGRF